MLTRNQLVLFFGRSRIVFYGFEFPAIFAFTSLCLRLAGCRQARQLVSAATRFVTQTLNFCHITEIFSKAILQTWQVLHVPSCLNHSPCTSDTVTVTNRLFFALCVKIKLFVSDWHGREQYNSLVCPTRSRLRMPAATIIRSSGCSTGWKSLVGGGVSLLWNVW